MTFLTSLRRLAWLGTLFAALFGGPAFAAEPLAFTPTQFAAAQQAGTPILVEISATWCSTCRTQASILEQLRAEPRFAGFQLFKVDFDSQKDAVRGLRAQSQSTLIVYKGKKELARSVGETNPAAIASLLAKAL